MNCPKCNTLLAIKMAFVGTPLDQPREYICMSCQTEYIGIPTKNELKEINVK